MRLLLFVEKYIGVNKINGISTLTFAPPFQLVLIRDVFSLILQNRAKFCGDKSSFFR
jgi:hypothetical protein